MCVCAYARAYACAGVFMCKCARTDINSLVFIYECTLEIVEGMLAESSQCSPLIVPYHLPHHRDANVMYWPSSVLLEQCAGTCGHSALYCRPARIQMIPKLVCICNNVYIYVTMCMYVRNYVCM